MVRIDVVVGEGLSATHAADSGIGNSIDFEAIVVRDKDGRLQQAFQVAGTPHNFDELNRLWCWLARKDS